MLNLFRKRSTFRKKCPKTVPSDNIKRKFIQKGLKQHIWSVFFGPLSIFECIQDLIFAVCHLKFSVFFFCIANVMDCLFFCTTKYVCHKQIKGFGAYLSRVRHVTLRSCC